MSISYVDTYFTTRQFLSNCSVFWESRGIFYPANALPTAEMEAEVDADITIPLWTPTLMVSTDGGALDAFVEMTKKHNGKHYACGEGMLVTVRGARSILGFVTIGELQKMFSKG